MLYFHWTVQAGPRFCALCPGRARSGAVWAAAPSTGLGCPRLHTVRLSETSLSSYPQASPCLSECAAVPSAHFGPAIVCSICNCNSCKFSLSISVSPSYWRPACAGIQEVSGKAGGCGGLCWCLWDARHLGCWKTFAPTLISFCNFHPAVWQQGLPPLLDLKMCGKSSVYTTANPKTESRQGTFLATSVAHWLE